VSLGDGQESPDHEKVGLTGVYVRKKNAILVRSFILTVATFLFLTVESLPQLAFIRQRICDVRLRNDTQDRPQRNGFAEW
jgi:hypothetical protein